MKMIFSAVFTVIYTVVCAAFLIFSEAPAEVFASETDILSYASDGELYVDIGTAEEPAEGVSLSLGYGYQDTAKQGRFLPVRMTVENNTETPISGKIELYMIESSDIIYCYEYPVSADARSSAKVSGNISIGENVGELLAVLKDESGETLSERQVRLNIDNSGPELFIGLISDTPTKLNYMSGVSLNKTALKTRTVTLDAKELPTTEEGLDQLDVIVISNYNVDLLDEAVTDVIWEWVEKGGTLLLGTGARHNPIGDFADHLPYATIGPPEIKPVNMGIQYSNEGLSGAILNIPVSDVYIEGGSEELSSDDTAVLTVYKAGNGTVGVTAYDLCDISEFCKEQISYTDELLTALTGAAVIERLSKSEEAGAEEYERITSLINTGNVESVPNLSLYMIAAVVYILAAGPGVYIFLRRRNLNIFYAGAATAVAVVASACVWFMGTGTRFAGPFINFASIKETGSEGESETDFIGVASPYNQPLRLRLAPEYIVRPVISGDKSTKSLSRAIEDRTLKRVNIEYKSENTYIETENIRPFSEVAFELYKNKTADGEEKPSLEAEVSVSDGKADVRIINNTDKKFTDAAIIFYGAIIKAGDIEAGEEKLLSGCELVFSPIGKPHVTGDYITGVHETESGALRKEYMNSLSKSGIIEYYMTESLPGYYEGAKLTAFQEGNKKPESVLTENISAYGTTLIAADAEDMSGKDGGVWRIALSEEPKVISGEYNAYTNTTQGNAAVVLEYSLGSDISVSGLKMNRISEEFEGMDDGGGSRLTAFKGNMAFYNYFTSSYDNIESGKTSFTGEELIPYLSPGNTVTVRYIPKESGGADSAVCLPVPAVTGVII